MSKATIGEAKYRCANDCQQSGCPGHTMVVKLNCSTDQYNVTVDGDEAQQAIFDENYLHALVDVISAPAKI
jgi:hypothetical protein